MFHIDEVITGKEVSVMFDDRNITAGLPEDTQGMFLPKGSSGRLFEYLHFDLPDILAHPLVEDGAEKIAKGFSRHSAVANAALLVRLRLDKGQKLYVLDLDPFKEPVNLGGMLNVLCMHHA